MSALVSVTGSGGNHVSIIYYISETKHLIYDIDE